MTPSGIAQAGDMVRVPGSDGLWYVTRAQEHTMSLLQVQPRFGAWLITDRDDVTEVMRPDYWNADG